MPLWSLISAPASSAETRVASLPYRRPWRAAAEIESARSSSPNKPAVWCRVDFCRFVAFSLCSGHRGDGGRDGGGAAQWMSARQERSAAATFGSTSSAAHRRPASVLPLNLMVERRPLQALTCMADLRIFGRRQLFFNLLADVPNGRSLGSSSAAIFGGLVPSGFVPGDEVAGRDWKQRRELGGDGPDGFSVSCCRVLFAKNEDLMARPLLEDHVLDALIDPRLEDRFCENEVYCMLHAANLCIRRDPHSRPRMSHVLRILEGDMVVDSGCISIPSSDAGSMSRRMMSDRQHYQEQSSPVQPESIGEVNRSYETLRSAWDSDRQELSDRFWYPSAADRSQPR